MSLHIVKFQMIYIQDHLCADLFVVSRAIPFQFSCHFCLPMEGQQVLIVLVGARTFSFFSFFLGGRFWDDQLFLNF